MKKWIALMTAALLLVVGLAACGNGETDNGDPTTTTQPSAVSPPGNYADNHSFVFRDVTITMGAAPAPVIAALGEPQNERREPNCAIEGEDVLVQYPGILITFTYPADGSAPFITGVRLQDDSITTPQGLYIGAAAERVAELYGQYDREVNGFYYFNMGNSYLEISVRDGLVDQIIYQYDFLATQ